MSPGVKGQLEVASRRSDRAVSELAVSQQLRQVQHGERGGGANAVQGLRDPVRRHGVRTGAIVVFYACLAYLKTWHAI